MACFFVIQSLHKEHPFSFLLSYFVDIPSCSIEPGVDRCNIFVTFVAIASYSVHNIVIFHSSIIIENDRRNPNHFL